MCVCVCGVGGGGNAVLSYSKFDVVSRSGGSPRYEEARER